MPNESQSLLADSEKNLNFMWVLCKSTMHSQETMGMLLGADGQAAFFLSDIMNKLSSAFFANSQNPETGANFNIKDPHTLQDYLDEMAWVTSKDCKSNDQEKSILMNEYQSAYSTANSRMQEQTNVLNGASQSSSTQASQDGQNLQSLVTVGSTGNSACSYLANILLQVMG